MGTETGQTFPPGLGYGYLQTDIYPRRCVDATYKFGFQYGSGITDGTLFGYSPVTLTYGNDTNGYDVIEHRAFTVSSSTRVSWNITARSVTPGVPTPPLTVMVLTNVNYNKNWNCSEPNCLPPVEFALPGSFCEGVACAGSIDLNVTGIYRVFASFPTVTLNTYVNSSQPYVSPWPVTEVNSEVKNTWVLPPPQSVDSPVAPLSASVGHVQLVELSD